MHLLYLGAFLFCGLHLVSGEDAINADIVNSRVQRTVDLTTHLPKVNSRITVENTGKTSVRFYILAIDPNLADNVSFVGASVRTIKQMKPRQQKARVWLVRLPSESLPNRYSALSLAHVCACVTRLQHSELYRFGRFAATVGVFNVQSRP